MTTVKELKEWLGKFPEDAEVQVVEGYTRGYETGARDAALRLDDNTSYFDFTDPVWEKMNRKCCGRKILVLGDRNA
jgi:hypothetical protein